LVVVVNKCTASASEIFAAAMQDYGRAVIAGDSTTFGKGTAQVLTELASSSPQSEGDPDSGGALMLTALKFYRVTGGSTQLKGVASDVTIPSSTDQVACGEGQLPQPLPYDEVKPLPWALATGRNGLFLDELRRRSARRIGQDRIFGDLAEDARAFTRNQTPSLRDIVPGEEAAPRCRKAAPGTRTPKARNAPSTQAETALTP
jgi:carboxyl-terminal processing protease